MSERLTRRVEALESKAGSTTAADIIEIVLCAMAPSPNGPVLLREVAMDGTILREYERAASSTDGAVTP